MVVLRTLGLWLVVLAFVALVVDGTRSIAASALVVTSFGETWYSLHPPSLNLSQAVVERYTFPVLWDPVIVSILLAPTWAVLGVLGLLVAFLGRRRGVASVIANQE
jgi:hypothetical protein